MNRFADIGVYAFIVGGILVMTRPGSQGPKLVNNLTNGFAHIVQASTGQRIK